MTSASFVLFQIRQQPTLAVRVRETVTVARRPSGTLATMIPIMKRRLSTGGGGGKIGTYETKKNQLNIGSAGDTDLLGIHTYIHTHTHTHQPTPVNAHGETNEEEGDTKEDGNGRDDLDKAFNFLEG